jgi:hypothetical protein
MSKIGIIVDGHGDFAALKKRYGGKLRILKTDGPRGHQAAIEDIVAGSRKQVSMLSSYGCAKAIVMLDYEGRRIRYEKFIKALKQAFCGSNMCLPVHVAVANQMIENWYLADIEQLSAKRKYIRDGLRQKRYEGRNGKKELKRCFKSNIAYRETTHGPDLFNTIRVQVARKNSGSFDLFLRLLDGRRET